MRIAISLAAGLGLLSLSHAQSSTRQDVLQTLGLSQGQVLRLETPAAGEGSFTVPIDFNGAADLIELHPHSIRSASHFQVLEHLDDGSYVRIPDPVARTYRGTLVGHPGSVVAGSLLDDGLHVRIRLAEGEDWWLEPVATRVPGASLEAHVLYSSSDVLDRGHRCGADLLSDNQGKNLGGGGGEIYGPGSSVEIAELALDCDWEYYNIWGSSSGTVDAVELVIGTMNPQYEYEVDITHELTTIIVRTSSNDPYTTSDPGNLLNQFRSHWNSTKGGVTRDVAELFTGRNLDGSVIGIAWLSVVCNTGWAYSVVQHLSALSSRTDLSAHELGHNWSSGHCSCSGYTMNSSLTSANRFTVGSENAIRGYANGVGCLGNSSGTPIFEDGFESGNITAGGWTKANERPKARKQARRSGNYGCNLKRTTWIEKEVSTLGYSQVSLVWTWRTKQFEAGASEEIFAEWSTDGGATWNLIDSHRGPQFQNEDHVLPAAAAGKPDLKIRFRTNATGLNSNTGKKKRGHVDVVRIIGD